jgi:hypothetical protein
MKHEHYVMSEFIGRVILGCAMYPNEVRSAIQFLQTNGGFNDAEEVKVFQSLLELCDSCSDEA